jgi:hypothetical protein
MFRRRYRPASFVVTYPSAREIAARFKGGTRPDGSGNSSCRFPGPIHKNGDQRPSLSIKDGQNGRPYLYCHASCGFRDIVAALVPVGSMTLNELSDAIPPAYTKFIAKAWLHAGDAGARAGEPCAGGEGSSAIAGFRRG